MNATTNLNLGQTAYPALAERFLDLNIPGIECTWRTAIEAALAQGMEVTAEELPFVQFLSAPVTDVQGWTWGASIQEAEQSGSAVNFAKLPLAEFIAQQEAPQAEPDYISLLIQNLRLPRFNWNRLDSRGRSIPALLCVDVQRPFYQDGMLHFPLPDEAGLQAMQMEILRHEMPGAWGDPYAHAIFAGDFNWGAGKPVVDHEYAHVGSGLPANQPLQTSGAVSEGAMGDRLEFLLPLMGINPDGDKEEAVRQFLAAMQPQAWCLTCRQLHADGEHGHSNNS
ncbi:MAG: hypothetical protein JNN26_23720 [Candidatus Obscuribacter sp.]|nr:hypothetical protein [Candidatus Obscuribacter sp.]